MFRDFFRTWPEKRSLFVVVLIAIGLRLFFAMLSDHIYHPDEIFQSLEPAYRFVYGYGIETWDLKYELRPGILILGLSPLFQIAKLLSLDISDTHLLIKLALTGSSLSIIFAGFVLATRYLPNSKWLVVTTLAVWYELIYFTSRAFSEVISVYYFALSVILLFTPKFQTRRLAQALGLVSLVIASYIRPQYALISLFILAPKSVRTNLNTRSLVYLCIGIVLCILADFFFYGHVTLSVVNNLSFSFLNGVSELFGTEPIWYLPVTLLITTGGLAILSLFTSDKLPLHRLLYLALCLIIIHSLVPHKEYRFIFAVIPITVSLASIVLYQKLTRISKHPLLLTLSIITLLSVTGATRRIPFVNQLYLHPFYYIDPVLHTTVDLGQRSDACGVLNSVRNWVDAGGYYYLGKNIPLYTTDYLPSRSENFNFYLSQSPTANSPDPVGYQAIKPIDPPSVTTTKTRTDCSQDLSYRYYRTFPEVEAILP